MTLKDKRIEWKARYDAWKESGLSVAEWCRNQEIKIHQMYYWVQRFENNEVSPETEPTQWLAVQVYEETIAPEGKRPIFIHFDAISVEVRPGVNVAYCPISSMSCKANADEFSIRARVLGTRQHRSSQIHRRSGGHCKRML